MWFLALVATAIAGPTGFYHPYDLGQTSERFKQASMAEVLHMEGRNRAAAEMSRALRNYRLSLDLLGDRAPAAERERLDAMEREYKRQFAVLQAFADTMVTDVDEEFGAAVDRAIETLGATAEVCEAEIADGPRVPGMQGRTKPNPACTGENLNATLARALDADPLLNQAVKEILAIEWPDITVPSEAQVPVGGSERSIDVRTLFEKAARDSLIAIEREDDDARMAFEVAIEEGEDLTGHVEAAHKLRAETAQKRADLAAPVLAGADGVLAKWTGKGEPATGWCVNPARLGGCTATDATKDLVGRLLEEKKVTKALP